MRDVTPAHVAAAAALVEEGFSVMLTLPDSAHRDGRPENEAMTTEGAAAKHGLVGRGVLLDVPRRHEIPWLEPGEHIFADDLEATERDQGVEVRDGDILLVRTGHARRLAELGPRNPLEATAGLHPTVMPFLTTRGVAALGCDGNGDTAPSGTEGVSVPIDVLSGHERRSALLTRQAITAMGIHLLDHLQFEDLRVACEQLERWEFLFVAGPLRSAGGTGSPLNPVAVF